MANSNTIETARTKDRLELIEVALVAMLPGSCGIKFDCLVWRVSDSAWSVGRNSVSRFEFHDLASACRMILALR